GDIRIAGQKTHECEARQPSRHRICTVIENCSVNVRTGVSTDVWLPLMLLNSVPGRLVPLRTRQRQCTSTERVMKLKPQECVHSFQCSAVACDVSTLSTWSRR